MRRKLSKFELERRVKNMVKKMISKPNKDQRNILAEALRSNMKVKT